MRSICGFSWCRARIVENVSTSVGSFLHPPGFVSPGLAAVLREGSLVAEAGRYAVRSAGERRAHRRRPAARGTGYSDPVILVPGFMAGDGTLRFMAGALRRQGFRTYRSHIHCQRRLHPRRRRPARGTAGIHRGAAGRPGADRRAQPRRDAGPRSRRTSSGPDLRRRHPGQPNARAGCPSRLTCPQRGRPGPAEPGRRAWPDVGGLRGRRVRPAELRREPPADPADRWRSPRSTPGATASWTGARA